MKGKKLKSDAILVKIAPEHKKILKQFASNNKMDLGSFMRQSALQAAEVSPFLNEEDVAVIEVLHEGLRKIGINLNQITRAINSGRHMSADEITKTVKAVGDIVELTQAQFAECLSQAARKQRSIKANV